MLFVLLLAVSALLATMDIIYDRYLSVNWWLLAMFFAFNLFACINVMLPVVWNFKNAFALRLSALLALAGFASFCLALKRSAAARPPPAHPGRRPAAGRDQRARPAAGPAGAAAPSAQQLRPRFRPGKPPAEISPAPSVRPAGLYKIYAQTAIGAPLGLKDRVGHRWYLNGKLVYASPFFTSRRRAQDRLPLLDLPHPEKYPPRVDPAHRPAQRSRTADRPRPPALSAGRLTALTARNIFATMNSHEKQNTYFLAFYACGSGRLAGAACRRRRGPATDHPAVNVGQGLIDFSFQVPSGYHITDLKNNFFAVELEKNDHAAIKRVVFPAGTSYGDEKVFAGKFNVRVHLKKLSAPKGPAGPQIQRLLPDLPGIPAGTLLPPRPEPRPGHHQRRFFPWQRQWRTVRSLSLPESRLRRTATFRHRSLPGHRLPSAQSEPAADSDRSRQNRATTTARCPRGWKN